MESMHIARMAAQLMRARGWRVSVNIDIAKHISKGTPITGRIDNEKLYIIGRDVKVGSLKEVHDIGLLESIRKKYIEDAYEVAQVLSQELHR